MRNDHGAGMPFIVCLPPFFFKDNQGKLTIATKPITGSKRGGEQKKNRPEDKSVDVSFSCIMMTAVNSEIRDKYIEHTTRKNFIEFSKTNLIY